MTDTASSAPASCQYSETEESDLWFQGATNLEGVTPALTCPNWCLNLPAILSSSWYQSGGIIIITWDEAPNTDLSGGGLPNTNGGQIATIVISANSHGAFAPAGNDYGILRAIEEAYGFTPLGNAANSANGDLSGAFDNAGNSGSISGAVTDSITHAGIVGASVTCTGSPTCTGTTTGAGGTYTLSNLAAGTYTVQASASGYGTLSQPDTVTTGAAPPDNFNLIPNAGTISGTVTAAAGGAGIEGATVACTGTLTCTSTVTSDSAGDYILSNLTEGSYQITASMTGYAPETFTVVVGPGGAPQQNFLLAASPGTISGTVKDSVTNAGVAGATVACSGTPTCTSATTASDGSYTLTVAAGTYTILVSHTGYTSQSLPGVIVTSGGNTPESFSLAPNPGTISGKVTNSVTGLPISSATVACTGTLMCTSATTLSDGTYSIGSLQEGTYQLTASFTNYSSENFNVSVGPGGAPSQNFTLVPNTGSISGTVTAAVGGAGIEGATVACTGTLTCTSTVTSDSSGDYLLGGLTEGTYQITASMTGYAPETFMVAVAPGGTPNQPFQLAASTLSVVGSFGTFTSGSAGSTTLTATTTTQTGTGDLLVLAIKTRSSPSVTVTGITDSASNTWKKATGVLNGQADEEIWYVPNAGSATSVTVTVSGATSMAMTVADVTGASTTSPLDQFATSSASAVPPQPTTRRNSDNHAGQRDRHRRYRMEQHRNAEWSHVHPSDDDQPADGAELLGHESEDI